VRATAVVLLRAAGPDDEPSPFLVRGVAVRQAPAPFPISPSPSCCGLGHAQTCRLERDPLWFTRDRRLAAEHGLHLFGRSVFEFGRLANRRTVCSQGANRQAPLACSLLFLLMTIRLYACSGGGKEHARFPLLFDPDRVSWPHRPTSKHAGIDAHVDLVVPGRGAQNPGISGQVCLRQRRL
jgi:hypothetical protein